MSAFPRFAPRLQQQIVARLRWDGLRPVQELAGEALLEGRNAVVLAPTAGGKTEAAVFPLLSILMNEPPSAVGALYIAPIKALLNNQEDRLGHYTEMVGLRRFVWHGDVPDSQRRSFLREPAELLMTTPESLEVMLVSKRVDAPALFGDLRMIVIDEVHALAGTDRGAHLASVIERLARLSRHDVQRVGLSATVGNPAAILRWLQGSSRREGALVDPPKEPAKRELLVLQRPTLEALAADAAEMAKGKKSLFFCQSRSTTEAVAEHMQRRHTAVFVHHSAVSLEGRREAEERFQKAGDACIVCTSTLELGLDVGDLDRVLQADAPATVSSFLQRMGRTGRRDGPANTTFFCESAEAVLQAIALIELARRGWVESVTTPTRCWPVLLHQLFAMALAGDGVRIDDAWADLSRVPDFAGITRAELDELVQFLLDEGALTCVGDRLVLGDKAEETFGRRNFMELYAVFSSPASYRIESAAGAPIGTLSQDFVDRLVPGISCFLLGGRAWVAARVDHGDRLIRAEPAPAGRQPTWGGFVPQFLGFEVCQQILTALRSKNDYRYLHASARASLDESRASFEGTLRSPAGGFQIAEAGEILWWTFAGGRINSTLRYLLQAVAPTLKVSADNFVVRVRRTSVSRLLEIVEKLREPAAWDDQELWRGLIEGLPDYRLSKFQPFLPPARQREMLRDYLLDVAGTRRWLETAGTLGEPKGPPSAAEIGEQSGLTRRIAEVEARLDGEAKEGPNASLDSLVGQWVAEAAVVNAARTPGRPPATDPDRWPNLCRVVAHGLEHDRNKGCEPDLGWRPAAADPVYAGRLLVRAVALARAPMPAKFEGTKYPPEDLDGLEDYVLVLLDMLERGSTDSLGRGDRLNLARTAVQLVEPLCAKLLAVLRPHEFFETLEKYEVKGKERLVGLHLLLQLLRSTGCGNLSPGFFTLLEKKPPSTDGWSTLDSFANALRDLYILRNRIGHKAPALKSEIADAAAWNALLVLVSLVDRCAADLDAVLPGL